MERRAATSAGGLQQSSVEGSMARKQSSPGKRGTGGLGQMQDGVYVLVSVSGQAEPHILYDGNCEDALLLVQCDVEAAEHVKHLGKAVFGQG